MLSAQDKALITAHPAGMVATVNSDGTPSVSPKATFVILDDTTLAFGNIRSPGTLSNLRERPRMEVCFIDVVLRKAVRVTGSATIHRRPEAPAQMQAAFNAGWGPYHEYMSHYVQIDVTRSEFILSPGYDRGLTEAQLREDNLAKLNAAYARPEQDS
jgi:hypothetical protein